MKALRIFLVLIFFGTRSAGLAEESPKDIVCEGSYLGHLQGIAHDETSFTGRIPSPLSKQTSRARL